MSYYDDNYSYENEQDYDPENAWLYEQNDNQNTRVSEIMICELSKKMYTLANIPQISNFWPINPLGSLNDLEKD